MPATPIYNPSNLLDALRHLCQLQTDKALGRAFGVPASNVSAIRNRKLVVGAGLLVRMHEATGLTVRELRLLMGDRRQSFRHGLRKATRSRCASKSHPDNV